MVYKTSNGNELLFNKKNTHFYEQIANKFNEKEILIVTDLLFDAQNKIKNIKEKRIYFEMLIYKIKNVSRLFSLSDNSTSTQPLKTKEKNIDTMPIQTFSSQKVENNDLDSWMNKY